MEEITAALVKNLLPRRRQDGHKGSFGRVYVYGGSVGYTGAPVFAGEAAVRTGSGLVYVGVPGEAYPVAAARCACAMAHPAPADYGELLERVSACGAVLIGPGLGRSPETDKTVRRLLEDCRAPVVLDADGINAISAHIDVLDRRRGRPEGGGDGADAPRTCPWAGSGRRRTSPAATGASWCSRGPGPWWPGRRGGFCAIPPATAAWPRAAAATCWRGWSSPS